MSRTALLAALPLSLVCLAGAVAQTPAVPSPSDYVKMAGQSDAFEIQEGQLAERMGKSAAVRRFGARMVKDHTKSTQMIMDAAARSGMPPTSPPPLNDEQAQNLAQLQAAAPADFDATYLQQQEKAHQQALDLQQAYAQSGSDPNLMKVAAKIVPVVQMHISMISSMKSGQ